MENRKESANHPTLTGKTICHVTISDASHERRLENQIRLMNEMGMNSILFALRRDHLPEEENRGLTRIIRIGVHHPEGGKRKFLEFNWKIFRKLMSVHCHIIHLHDLWPMPGVILAAWIRRIPVLYDAHEYYRGLEIFRRKKWEKRIWSLAEYIGIRFVDAIITVSEPLLHLYRQTYPVLKRRRAEVVRNVPERWEKRPEMIDSGDFPPLIFQGIFKPGRGLPALIKALTLLPEMRLVMVGYGELEQELRQLVRDLHLEDRVWFYGRVSPEEMIPLAARSRIGLVLFEPTSLNYTFALPNKFFEYIQAEIPIISSRIPTFEQIFSQYPYGQLVNPSDPEDIAKAIDHLMSDKELYHRCLKNVSKMKEIFTWEHERMKLKKLYRTIILAKLLKR